MAYPLQQSLQPAPYWYRRLIISSLLLTMVFLSAWASNHTSTQPKNTILDNEQQEYLRTVESMFNNAQQRIWIMMYVMRRYDQQQHSINKLYQLLAQAQQRGVDVRVVLDRSDREGKYPGPDNSVIATWLRQHQIPVILDEIQRTTHAKIVLIDQHVIIGSHNWTGYAVSKNREISVLTQAQKTIQEIEAVFAEIAGFHKK